MGKTEGPAKNPVVNSNFKKTLAVILDQNLFRDFINTRGKSPLSGKATISTVFTANKRCND